MDGKAIIKDIRKARVRLIKDKVLEILDNRKDMT